MPRGCYLFCFLGGGELGGMHMHRSHKTVCHSYSGIHSSASLILYSPTMLLVCVILICEQLRRDTDIPLPTFMPTFKPTF